MRWMLNVGVVALFAGVNVLAPGLAVAADEDDIVILYPEYNPLTTNADDDDIVYLVPEHNPLTVADGDGDGIKDYWDPDDDNAADEDDDIVFLRPEHNPLTVADGDGDGIKDYWDPDDDDAAADEDDIVYLRPEHNPLTAPDFDNDGIKDYWDPDDDAPPAGWLTSPMAVSKTLALAGATKGELAAVAAELGDLGEGVPTVVTVVAFDGLAHQVLPKDSWADCEHSDPWLPARLAALLVHHGTLDRAFHRASAEDAVVAWTDAGMLFLVRSPKALTGVLVTGLGGE